MIHSMKEMQPLISAWDGEDDSIELDGIDSVICRKERGELPEYQMQSTLRKNINSGLREEISSRKLWLKFSRLKVNLRGKRGNAVLWPPALPQAPKIWILWQLKFLRHNNFLVPEWKWLFIPNHMNSKAPSNSGFPAVHVFISLFPPTKWEHNSPEQNLTHFRHFCWNYFPRNISDYQNNFSRFS